MPTRWVGEGGVVEKYINKIIIDVKAADDFRPSILCRNSRGHYWELRGEGHYTPHAAFAQIMQIWNETEEEDWDLWGCPVSEKDADLRCDQCGRYEIEPFDEGDNCYCGGVFRMYFKVQLPRR